ncbi:hypothetical protein KIN20_029745 [Parelaphostrongylus tenuis]|uniref:Peptidase M12A domain-containing protein n=1 Tax=Parelaphostrongylus tenuis TaxID=148309 RepID=A0AAD5N006_PARTN|nr:hypothetical protein KIN20_015240 [Parelaphostrongylus tenuis]KAJ1360050.1 hypothetical protein KIN20_018930 [Parelaphostrongylus tenuis]KAJ1368587.1 hypothetical protein KIN20_029745 [Parelaphostrongylus tenuis]
MFNDSEDKWNLTDSKGRIVIPYIISGKFDDSELNTIKKAMNRIRRNTCLRFRKRKTEADYVDIQSKREKGRVMKHGHKVLAAFLRIGSIPRCVK